MRRLKTIGPALALALLASTATAQDKSVNPGINDPFKDPDVAEFRKRFEDESREVFARRREIVEALGLRSGQAVADVGAGTGAFVWPIAEKVGPGGKVYAVDIAQPFLDHIAAGARERKLDNVVCIKGTHEATYLPPESVDFAFLCDVYHHLEFPAKTLASIRRALKPGGALVVVEFDRREGVSSEFVLKHVRAGKDVFIKEIEAAGFERVEAGRTPPLKENAFLRFRKPPAPAPAR
jgi:ubiquinone/menaquinone biosynthesis C-methylase UbiE